MRSGEFMKGGFQHNKSSFEKIYRKLYPRLCTFANKYVRSHAVAEDIVSEAMILLWEKDINFINSQAIKSYAYKTVHSKCINHLRKHKKEDLFTVVTNENGGPNVEHIIIEQEVHGQLYEALQSLPEGCKNVFLLSCVEGLKYKEVAEDLNISINTVKSQRARALELLKKKLGTFAFIYLQVSFFCS